MLQFCNVPFLLLGKYNVTGQTVNETVYLFGQPVAVLKGAEVFNVHADHLGSPRKISNQSGAVVWAWAEQPFGDVAANQDPDNDGVAFEYNLRFPRQFFDRETGLYYNFHRYYDAQTGRYITSDPIGLSGGLNTFGYVGGNPLKKADPFGLIDIFIGGAYDGTSHIVYDYYNDFYKYNYPNRTAKYFEWDQPDEISEEIRKAKGANPCEPVNLVGHSWGGDTAVDVASDMGKEGIIIDLLTLIDPVGHFPSEIGANLVKTVNAGSFPNESNGFGGDTWAFLGGQWGTGYSTPYHHNEFSSMMNYRSPNGTSPLDNLLNSNSGCMCLR